MSIRGRKPKPVNLKIIEGNPGKRAINRNEPKPRPIRPSCPRWLLSEAKAEWRRIAPELERMGLLTIVDRAALAAYCQAWARMVDAEAKIEQYGSILKAKRSDYVQVSPYETLRRQNANLVRAFCTEFGLTPSSRGRMTVPGSGDEGECPKCSMPLTLCGCG